MAFRLELVNNRREFLTILALLVVVPFPLGISCLLMLFTKRNLNDSCTAVFAGDMCFGAHSDI